MGSHQSIFPGVSDDVKGYSQSPLVRLRWLSRLRHNQHSIHPTFERALTVLGCVTGQSFAFAVVAVITVAHDGPLIARVLARLLVDFLDDFLRSGSSRYGSCASRARHKGWSTSAAVFKHLPTQSYEASWLIHNQS